MIGLRDVEVVAGGRAILAVERLDVAAGETLAVLGANGAGKSTLLRVAGGLLRPDRGELLLDGRPAAADAVRRASAAVLQRPLLRRAATVRANVETGLRFAGVARDERRARSDAWMERLALASLAGRRARTLSGGEAQRVSLARALVLEPRLLLLDEPFAALDAPSRAELLAELRDLLESSGTSTIFVTHDRHEAAAIADRVALLHAGTLRQLGTPGAVLDHPADADCARLLGFENLLPPGLVAADRVAVRATAVRVAPGGAATVERVLPFGERTRLVVRIDGTRIVSDVPATSLRQGDRVDVVVDPADVRPVAG